MSLLSVQHGMSLSGLFSFMKPSNCLEVFLYKSVDRCTMDDEICLVLTTHNLHLLVIENV